MVLSTETFKQSVRTEYSEAVNARYTFQPLRVSDLSQFITIGWLILELLKLEISTTQGESSSQTRSHYIQLSHQLSISYFSVSLLLFRKNGAKY